MTGQGQSSGNEFEMGSGLLVIISKGDESLAPFKRRQRVLSEVNIIDTICLVIVACDHALSNECL